MREQHMKTGDPVYLYGREVVFAGKPLGAPYGTLVDPRILTREQLLDAVEGWLIVQLDHDDDGDHFAICGGAELCTAEEAF
jgi:hypothetical protein